MPKKKKKKKIQSTAAFWVYYQKNKQWINCQWNFGLICFYKENLLQACEHDNDNECILQDVVVFLIKAAASEISLLITLAPSYACALQSGTFNPLFSIFQKCFS